MAQYTLRNVPQAVDHALRQRARIEHKSLNQVTIESLIRALGVDVTPARQRSLKDVAGSWCADPDTEHALAEQRHIDSELWR